MGVKLALWPTFQKELDANLEAVKKLAVAAQGGGIGEMLGGAGVKDAKVQGVRP